MTLKKYESRLQELREEKERFLETISALDRRLSKGEISVFQRQFTINSVTKGLTESEYQRKIDSDISRIVAFLEKKRFRDNELMNIIKISSMLIGVAIILFIILSPEYSVILHDVNTQTIIVNRTYSANTSIYAMTVKDDTIIRSVKINGEYHGNVRIYLVQNDSIGNDTAKLLVFDSRKYNSNLSTITGHFIIDTNQSVKPEEVKRIALENICMETCQTTVGSKNVYLLIEADNGSEVVIDNIVYTQPTINHPPRQVQRIDDIEMKTYTYRLALSGYFTDEDNDRLTFEGSNIPGLHVSVSRDIITFSTIEDAGSVNGTYTGFVYVSDGIDTINSNLFKITVNITRSLKAQEEDVNRSFNDSTRNTTLPLVRTGGHQNATSPLTNRTSTGYEDSGRMTNVTVNWSDNLRASFIKGYGFPIDPKLLTAWNVNPKSEPRIIIRYKNDSFYGANGYLDMLKKNAIILKNSNPQDYNITSLLERRKVLEQRINSENLSGPSGNDTGQQVLTGNTAGMITGNMIIEPAPEIPATQTSQTDDSYNASIELSLIDSKISDAKAMEQILSSGNFSVEENMPDAGIEVIHSNSTDIRLLNGYSEISAVYLDEPVELLTAESMNITRISYAKSQFSGLSGLGIKICILDTGVNPSIVKNYAHGYDFINGDNDSSDDNGHGTEVGYILYSVAPASELVVAKVLDSQGQGYESGVLAGLEYCMEQNASIISVSLGSGGYDGYCDGNIVAQAVNDLAVNYSILTIAATGNDGSSLVKSPACARDALAVGASDKLDRLWGWTSYDNATLLVAPGVNINTFDMYGNPTVKSGTSVAVPFVAGSAVLKMQSENKAGISMDASTLKNLIVHTGKIINVSDDNGSVLRLFSRLDAFNLLIENITNNLTEGGLGNYSIEGNYSALTYMGISFVSPTPANATVTTNTSVIINISMTNANNLSTFKFNWNGTNYTYYNASLWLLMNFDNISAIGESSTKIVDVSKYANNGTASGGATWTSSGKYRGAYQFDGVNGKITTGSDFINTQAMTICAWIYPIDWGANSKGRIVDNTEVLFYMDNVNRPQGITFTSDGGTTYPGTSDYAISLNTWQHVCVSRDASGTANLYINGTLNGAANQPSGTPVAGSNVIIGSRAADDARAFHGTIDELQIWNKTLSAAEISQIYKSNLNKYNTSVWQFYTNQSNLAVGTYTYYGYMSNITAGSNQTLTRTLTINTTASSFNCSSLNVAGTVYNLTTNASINGATCFTVTAENVTLDCKGYSIIGDNTSYTYGIYTNKYNTTIKNCIVSTFDVPILVNNTNNCLIQNVYAQTSTYDTNGNMWPYYSSAIALTSVSNSRIDNSTGNATYAYGYGIISYDGQYNTISNSSGYSIGESGIATFSSSYTNFTNSYAWANVLGFYIHGSDHEILTNVTAVSSGYGFEIDSSSNSEQMINSTYQAFDGGIYIVDTPDRIQIVGLSGSSVTTGIKIYGGTNVLVDCQGGNITGGSETGTYGVHTTQFNTTIKNCNINLFDTGIFYEGATNGTIQNNNINTTINNLVGPTYSSAIWMDNADYSILNNNTAYAKYGFGIDLAASSYSTVANSIGISENTAGIRAIGGTNNTIINSSGICSVGEGMSLSSISNYNIINSTATSTTGNGIDIDTSTNNNILNCQISGNHWKGALRIESSSANNTIANSTINGLAGSCAIGIVDGYNNNNTFINNTILNADTLVWLDADSANNKFYWNTFTGAGYWMENHNATNMFNTTNSTGTIQGNYYTNISTYSITDNNNDGWGDSGTQYPINNNTIPTKWTGLGADYGPATTKTLVTLNCSSLNVAGATYNMTGNLTINGSTCFTVTAANVTLDCVGYSMTGNKTANTYGVYSDKFNTTIKNCIIKNFYTGIYFNGANNGTIQNSNANVSSGEGIYLAASSYNNITTVTGASNSSRGIFLQSGSNSNTMTNVIGIGSSNVGIQIDASSNNGIINSTGISFGSEGILLVSNSNNNTIINATVTSTYIGLEIMASFNNTVTNTIINDLASNIYGALCFYSNSQNNTVANSTINGLAGTGNAIGFNKGNNTGNTLINNTILNATTLLFLDANASKNTFYWNNFTATTGFYVNDTNGTNYYNATINGQNEGNVWYNVINGSVIVNGSSASTGYPNLYVGTQGTGYPYNTSTSQGKFICGNSIINYTNCADYRPLTQNAVTGVLICSRLNNTGTIYNLTANASINGATCFNVTAENVTLDCQGYSIIGNNATWTYGVYTEKFNTTIRNCNIRYFDAGIYYNTASNGLIENNNINISSTDYVYPTDSSGILLYDGASYNIIRNNTAYSHYGIGIFVLSNSNYNNITNSSGTSGISSEGIYILGSSDYINIINSTGTSTNSSGGIHLDNSHYSNIINSIGVDTDTGRGMYIELGSNNTVANSIATSNGWIGLGIGTSSNNMIANSTISSVNSNYEVYIGSNSTNNTLVNNTLVSSFVNDPIVYIDSTSGWNKFYWNNLTGSNIWVDNSNSTNMFNTTNSTGTIQGNYYPNIATYNIADNNRDGWGDNGTQYPINSTNIPDKWAGLGADYGPATSRYSLEISNSRISPPDGGIYLPLNGYCNAIEVSGRNVSYSYVWYLNGAINSSGNTSINYTQGMDANVANISTASLSVGQNWTLGCRASNGMMNSSWLNSSKINITAVAIAPTGINFTNPTPLDGYSTTNNWTYVNTSVTYNVTTGNMSAFIDWNRSLVGWWRLNNETGENATFFKDSSSWGNNATCSGAACPTFTTTGKMGGAYQFDGANNYLTVPSNQSLNVTNKITMEFWIKPGALPENYVIWKASPESDSITKGYAFLMTSGTLYVRLGDGTSRHQFTVGHSMIMTGTTWYHIAAVYNGTTLSIYSNGALIYTSSDDIFTIVNDNTPLYIGSRGGDNYWFNGTIDEVKIWNRALSAQEINASYDAGTYRLERNFTYLSPGQYQYKAYAQDNAGTVYNTETRTVNIFSAASCQNITLPNTNLMLGRNLTNKSTCFNVWANNVSIDCAGYSIIGNNTPGTYGVFSNASNTTVRNCNIQNFSEGIRYSGATDGRIYNNTINTTYNGGNGIKITSNAHRNNITQNTITSGNASGIYIDGGQNTTVDCAGKNIIGGNFSGTYGIYTSQYNTTVKNCIINNFSIGIYFDTASNSTIDNTNVSTTKTYSWPNGVGILLYPNANYNAIRNSNTNAPNGYGIILNTNSNYNTLTNVTSTSSVGIDISASSYNIINNSVGISTSYGINLEGGSYNTITNSTATSNDTAIYLYSSSNNSIIKSIATSNGGRAIFLMLSSGNNITKSAAISNNGFASIHLYVNSTNNTFVNNTIISNGTTIFLSIDSTCANNLFYWNNFTGTGAWIGNDNETNMFNTSVAGKAQGNYYPSITSYAIYDGNGDGWGDAGAQYPVSAATIPAKWTGLGADYGPGGTGTGFVCSNLNTAGTTYNLSTNISINGSTCFTVSAENVTLDCKGYSIIGNNTINTSGIYANSINSTVKNCRILGFNTGIYYDTASDGAIKNTFVNATVNNSIYPVYASAIFFDSASGNILDNDTVYSSYGNGISLFNGANSSIISNTTAYSYGGDGIATQACGYNSIINSKGISTSGAGIVLSSSSGDNVTNSLGSGTGPGISISSSYELVINSTGISSAYIGIYLVTASQNAIINSTASITSTTSGYAAFYFNIGANYNTFTNGIVNGRTVLWRDANNNNITNSVLNGMGSDYGIEVADSFEGTRDNNSFINNTIVNATNGIYFDVNASNNLVYWNTFNVSGMWVVNNNETNMFNTSVAGVAQGNYYQNITAYNIFDSDVNGWGDIGSQYPASAATIPDKWSGFGQDFGPATTKKSMQIYTSRILPNPAYADSGTLMGYCNGTDVAGHNLTYYYTWYLNGAINTSGISTTNYTQGLDMNVNNKTGLSLGQSWIFSCLAYNGIINSTWLNSSAVVIQVGHGLGVEWVTPVTNAYADRNLFKYFTVNVSCRISTCGNVSVYLDPVTDLISDASSYAIHVNNSYIINLTDSAQYGGTAWYDLETDPSQTSNLVSPASDNSMFAWWTYTDDWAYSQWSTIYSARVLENTSTRIVIERNGYWASHWNTTSRLIFYPTGQIYYYENITSLYDPINYFEYPFVALSDGFNDNWSIDENLEYILRKETGVSNSPNYLTIADRDYSGGIHGDDSSDREWWTDGSDYTLYTGDSAKRTLAYVIKPNDMSVEQAIARRNDYRTPATIANGDLVMTIGASKASDGLDYNHDGFAEGEGAYVMESVNGQLQFTMNGSSITKYTPVFKILNYTINIAPMIFITNGSGTFRLKNGTGYNANFQNNDAGTQTMILQLLTNINSPVTIKIGSKTGLVSTTQGDLPFYTNGSNPISNLNNSCLQNMVAGQSCIISWAVNATGDLNTTHTFYAYANSSLVSANYTSYINITIGSAPASYCLNITTPGTYTLISNVSINGSTCFNITAANVTLDCAGYSITGNNTPNTQGIYTNSTNSTVKNCIITGFDTAIYYNTTNNGLIQNNIVNSSVNNFVSPAYASAIFLFSGANYNTLINNTAHSIYGPGIFISYSSYDNVTNCTGDSDYGIGIDLTASSSNNIFNSQIRGNSTTYGALALYAGSNNNRIENCTINGRGSDYAIKLQLGSTGNTLVNNTILNATTLVDISSADTNNIFYWNTFSGSGIWVNNLNATNMFNTTNSTGTRQGNYYQGITDYNISDSNSDGWGDSGTQYPINNNTIPTKWTGLGADYGPATSTALPMPSIPVLISPNNGNITIHEHRPVMVWNNSNLAGWYDINITSNNCAPTQSNNTNNGSVQSNFTPSSDLCLQTEGGINTYYNWTVRACNAQACSNWSQKWNFSIEPYLAITMLNDNVTFGTRNPGDIINTTNASLTPFTFQNDGNVYANLTNTTVSQALWTNLQALLGTRYMQIEAGQTNETQAFNTSTSVMSWINASSNNSNMIQNLGYTNTNDTAYMHVLIEVPQGESYGIRNTSFTFMWQG